MYVTAAQVLRELCIWSFVLLLHVQAALLHPYFTSSALARVLRLVLCPPAVYTALTLYQYHRFPEKDTGLNFFVLGGTCVHYACLSVNFAFAKEPCWRIVDASAKKKDDDADVQKDNPAMLEDPVAPTRRELVGFAFALVGSVRGIGWSFAPPERVLPRPRPEPWAPFVRGYVLKLIGLQVSMLLAQAVLIPARSIANAGQVWTYWIGDEPPLWFDRIAPCIVTYLWGVATWSAIAMRGALGVVIAGFIHYLARSFSPISPKPFDTTSHPPLFRCSSRSTSLDDFWTYRWHCVMRRDVTSCGSTPMKKLFGWAGQTTRRMAGILGAFFISGSAHEYSLWVGVGPERSFATLTFFFMQGVGMCLEILWNKATGRKVGGPLGWFWTFAWMIYWGMPMAESWYGVQRGAAMPHDWDAKKIFLPYQVTAPTGSPE